jgi:pimeloyl-ACP methyl ester carboxylesterase
LKNGDVEIVFDLFGDGPPIVFGHGLSANRQHARRELEPLASRYTCIVFDQRGHGESTPIYDPAQYEPNAMSRDLESVLDALKIDRAIVAGESMGAAVALIFALRAPDRIEKLFLLAPAFGHRPNPDREHMKYISNEILTEGIDGYLRNSAQRLRMRFAATDRQIRYLAAMHSSHDPRSLATAFASVSQWVLFDDLARLADLDVPTVVTGLENDTMHPLALAKEIAEALPRAELAVVNAGLKSFSDPAMVGRGMLEYLGT